MIRQALAALRDGAYLLFPWSCHVCDARLEGENFVRWGLCRTCAEQMPWMEGECCEICGISLSSEEGTCLSCRAYGQALPSVSRLRSCFLYSGVGKRVLHAYKSGARSLCAYWASCLEQLLPQVWEEGIVLAGIPSSPRNIRKRGFDQVSLVLNNLSAPYGSAVLRKVFRRLPSRSQKELGRAERKSNLSGRIRVRAPIAKGTRFLLVDDVCTTGATLAECAAALLDAGASECRAITLFRD